MIGNDFVAIGAHVAEAMKVCTRLQHLDLSGECCKVRRVSEGPLLLQHGLLLVVCDQTT